MQSYQGVGFWELVPGSGVADLSSSVVKVTLDMIAKSSEKWKCLCTLMREGGGLAEFFKETKAVFRSGQGEGGKFCAFGLLYINLSLLRMLQFKLSVFTMRNCGGVESSTVQKGKRNLYVRTISTNTVMVSSNGPKGIVQEGMQWHE